MPIPKGRGEGQGENSPKRSFAHGTPERTSLGAPASRRRVVRLDRAGGDAGAPRFMGRGHAHFMHVRVNQREVQISRFSLYERLSAQISGLE